MMLMHNLPPGLILIFAAFLVYLLPGRLKNWCAIIFSVLAFWQIVRLSGNAILPFQLLDLELAVLRVDGWSKAFAYIFTLSSFAAFLYGYHEKKSHQLCSGLLYIGSALMVVFAGDLITLYIFWEVMAITSVYLILGRKTKKSYRAAFRYILVHIFGGLVLLAGIVITIQQSGSIAFNAFDPANPHLGTWLILAGFLVNAAAIPFSSWLPDAYPEASIMGGVILSAYTSKTAVYALLRGFPGWEILIIIGSAMAIYGVIYALLENDIRRMLAYAIVGQVGFMVCAVGIGTPLALNGVVVHAFCHIIYKGLLWMSAGAVIYRVGKSKFTELGGLYRSMPWTTVFGCIGALAIAAPLTSGFISKNMILAEAASNNLFWPWFILKAASVGAFISIGLKFPYFVFFGKSKVEGLPQPHREAPKAMLFAMSFMAFFCIYLGIFPGTLYNILPGAELVKSVMPYTFWDIYIYHFSSLVFHVQLLSFATLAFFLILPFFKQTNTITLDIDWFYRRGGVVAYLLFDQGLNGVNNLSNRIVVESGMKSLAKFFRDGPARILLFFVQPLWSLTGVDREGSRAMEIKFINRFRNCFFSIGNTAVSTLALILLLLLV